MPKVKSHLKLLRKKETTKAICMDIWGGNLIMQSIMKLSNKTVLILKSKGIIYVKNHLIKHPIGRSV